MNETLLNYLTSSSYNSVIFWLFIYSMSQNIRYSTTLQRYVLCLFARWRHRFDKFWLSICF